MNLTQNYSHKQEFIRLSESKNTKKALFLVGISLSLLTCLTVYLLTGFKPRFQTIGLTVFLISMICIICLFFSRKLATASLKQDLIFVSHPHSNARPVKLSWLKSVKSIPFFGFSLCKITYRYDGIKYSSILVGKKEDFKNYLQKAS